MLLLKSNITFWKGTRPNPSFNTTMIWRNINRLNFWICKLGKEKKTTEKNHYSDLPYKRKQIVEKFQNLFCAGVTEDRISSGCITHHKSPSFGLFYISGPASSFHNTQNAIHTKAHLQKNTEMKGRQKRGRNDKMLLQIKMIQMLKRGNSLHSPMAIPSFKVNSKKGPFIAIFRSVAGSRRFPLMRMSF